jgi:hypothetical protein
VDGKDLLRDLRILLNEQDSSAFLDDRSSYDVLWKGAIEVVSSARIHTASQVVTTIANQAAYNLYADFLDVYTTDDQNRKFVMYDAGNGKTPIFLRDYPGVIYTNSTTSVSVPSTFSIVDAPALSILSGTASAAGAVSGGEAILTDATAPFASVAAGDAAHNTFSGHEYDGIVTYVNSSSSLITCMFDESSTPFGWANADTYRITPQGRFQLVLDPPPLTAGQTVTVPYVQRPAPVFSPYRAYRIPINYKQALLSYAAAFYKMREEDDNGVSRFFALAEDQMMRARKQFGKSLTRNSWRVNFVKRAYPDRSVR